MLSSDRLSICTRMRAHTNAHTHALAQGARARARTQALSRTRRNARFFEHAKVRCTWLYGESRGLRVLAN
eukprot:5676801-Pleurochrysis_carterae.AAC.1